MPGALDSDGDPNTKNSQQIQNGVLGNESHQKSHRHWLYNTHKYIILLSFQAIQVLKLRSYVLYVTGLNRNIVPMLDLHME